MYHQLTNLGPMIATKLFTGISPFTAETKTKFQSVIWENLSNNLIFENRPVVVDLKSDSLGYLGEAKCHGYLCPRLAIRKVHSY